MVRVIRKNKIKKLDEIGQDNVVMNDSYDKLSLSLDANEKVLRQLMKDNQFVVYRRFENTENDSIKFSLIFADGMADKKILNGNVIEPVMSGSFKKVLPDEGFVECLINKAIPANEIGKTTTIEIVITALIPIMIIRSFAVLIRLHCFS